jgi:hypothetical protein
MWFIWALSDSPPTARDLFRMRGITEYYNREYLAMQLIRKLVSMRKGVLMVLLLGAIVSLLITRVGTSERGD